MDQSIYQSFLNSTLWVLRVLETAICSLVPSLL